MQSKNFPYNARLDHLRFLAAMLVFVFHMFHYLYHGWQPASERPWLGVVSEGHTGVALFFTLSGFLFMQIALHVRQIDYRAFVRNRLLRIFPLFLVIFFTAISMARDAFRAQDVFYLAFSNLGLAPTSSSFITGASWTISLEFTFYLVFPFLARFAMQRGVRYLLSLLLLLLLIKLAAFGIVEKSTHMYYSTLIGRFDQFVIGMLAAMLFASWRERLSAWRLPLLLLAALWVFTNSFVQAKYASYFLAQPKQSFWVVWSMLESAGWASFIVAWLNAAVRLPAWLDRLMCRGGEISYSFYLLHGLVLYLVHQHFGQIVLTGKVLVDGALNLAVYLPLCWAVAALSYHTIEKPFLELRHKY